jgi:GNAT superfamily N-acetyltransferase
MTSPPGRNDAAVDLTLRIRAADLADDELLMEMQRAASVIAFRHIFPPALYPFPSGAIRATWQQQLADPDVRILIAERRGRPVGAAAYTPRRFLQLWVVPAEWGRGVAARLYEEVHQGLRGSDSSVCELWVLEDNPRARRFYERRGWKIDGRRMTTPYPPHPALVGYRLTIDSQVLGSGGTRGPLT